MQQLSCNSVELYTSNIPSTKYLRLDNAAPTVIRYALESHKRIMSKDSARSYCEISNPLTNIAQLIQNYTTMKYTKIKS